MSQIVTAADEAARERPDAERHTDLADALAELSDVYSVHVHGERTPARVEVILDVANVTPPVEDLLDAYDAVIASDSVEVSGRGTLAFEVSTPEGFRNADSREIRTHGTSIVVTLTREALDLSGLGEGVKVNEQARDDAILLTRHED